MDYSRPRLADRLAANYVLGTLRGAARRRLETLLPAHPSLRQAVNRWQDALVPLASTVPVPASSRRRVKPATDWPSTFCDVRAMPAWAPWRADSAVLAMAKLDMGWGVGVQTVGVDDSDGCGRRTR